MGIVSQVATAIVHVIGASSDPHRICSSFHCDSSIHATADLAGVDEVQEMNTKEESAKMAKHYGISTGHRWPCARCGLVGKRNFENPCPEFDFSKHIDLALQLVAKMDSVYFRMEDNYYYAEAYKSIKGGDGESRNPSAAIHAACWEVYQGVKGDTA